MNWWKLWPVGEWMPCHVQDMHHFQCTSIEYLLQFMFISNNLELTICCNDKSFKTGKLRCYNFDKTADATNC